MPKKRVLFMCTGNSCRSQIAEAIVNSKYGDIWNAFSGGSRPAGYVHPIAVKALSEIGIEHHGRSKSIDEFRGQAFDLVVTLCDEAEGECPVWLGKGTKIHTPFPDPAKASGSEAEILSAFRTVRNAIETTLPQILNN
jgi:arsenate reductase